MIWAQIVLLAVVLLITLHFVRHRRSAKTQAYKKMLLILFVVASIIAILFPDLLTSLAHFLGIGRGADLLLYATVMIVLFQLINNYAKDRHEQQQIHQLARKVAILDANLRADEARAKSR